MFLAESAERTLIPPTGLSVMPDRLGPAAQTCPGAAPAAAGQRAPRPVAPGDAALSTRKRNRYDGLRSANALPASRIRPDPIAAGLTRTHRSHVRLRRLGESGRGEDCSESTTSQAKTCPATFCAIQSLFKRFVGPGTVISKADSIINHLWSSSGVRPC